MANLQDWLFNVQESSFIADQVCLAAVVYRKRRSGCVAANWQDQRVRSLDITSAIITDHSPTAHSCSVSNGDNVGSVKRLLLASGSICLLSAGRH
jgi:hypothetical protein